MPFPTVKSNPWKKNTPRRGRLLLWSNGFWTQLVKQAAAERAEGQKYGIGEISPVCLEMIREMNLRLYGLNP
jgi:hypothetical protein